MKSKVINFYGFSFHPAGLRSCGAVPCRGQMITRCYIINKIKEQSMQFVDTAYKAAMDIADKGKNQLDLASQQNRLAKAQRQLGALVYSLHKANEENQPLVDKYIENIAEIEKAIEEIKARMTPDEAAAAEAAEAEQEAEDPNDPTTYHDDPAGLTPEEEQALADAADRPRGETKECPVCHADVDADALFCNHCGAQL